MKLISLALRNFMPYKGEQGIAFPVEGTRNVIIIYGDNMRGKTSVLNAIRWALYGRVFGRHGLTPIPKIYILNKDAAFERDFVVSVTLRFEHDGTEYEIIRTMKPKELIDTPREDDHLAIACFMRRAGAPVTEEQIEHQINRILPESIARFSLFDGELLQEYEQLVADATDESNEIKEAIEKALGVPALINGRDHVQEILHRAQRQFTREGNKDSQHAKLIQQTMEELESAKKERDRLHDLLQGVTAERDILDDELRRFEVAETTKAKLEENRRQQKDATGVRDRALERRRTLAPRAWMAILVTTTAARKQELEEQLLKAQGRLEEAVQIRVEHRLRLASLQSGTCALCGTDLADRAKHDVAHRARSEQPVGELSSFSTDFASSARQFEKLRALHDSSVGDELVQAEREFDRATVEINRLRQREMALLAEIQGIDIDAIGRKRERRDLLQREIGRLDAQFVAQQTKCMGIQKKCDALMKAAASGQQGSAQFIARKVTLLSALAEVLEKSVDKLRHNLRGRVEAAATQTFKRLTTEKEYSGLVINDRYGLEIRDHLDRPVSVRSAGAEQIVALSLIDGLAHASGSPGLLVMDTPFGRLDLKHRAQVLSYLPSMAKQVILLVHEGELSSDRDLPFVAEHVAASYEIERVTETQSKLVRR